MLADDSVTAQNMGRKILADAGYEVITVNNGSAALKKISEQKPDVIVLDVYMPGYSGLEVCQRLKDAHETARIPVLLTVGKLEPFKPEESRRCGADGFIVKPFEASELLSALAKLEDRIVPRQEYKQGRFARAAAIEESRFDRTMAVEEDSGWKSRISFPSKKKEKPPEREVAADDPALYNPVNKDLRTVVEHKPAEHAAPHDAVHHEAATHEAPKHEQAKVDLGALAPEGLPKDVTPEEIAALAAAAAQVKGKMAESQGGEPAEAEVKPQETRSDSKDVESFAVKPEAQPTAEIHTEIKAEAKTEAEVKGALNTEGEREEKKDEPEQAPAATFAEQKPAEKTEAAEKSGGVPAEAASIVPSPADVMAAIAHLEPESKGAKIDDQASWSQKPAEEPEPVTMAVAAGAASAATASRWTAVSVALAPEETGISLEQEMKASAAPAPAADPLTAPLISDAQPAVSASPSVIEAAFTPETIVAPAPHSTDEVPASAEIASEPSYRGVKESEITAAEAAQEAAEKFATAEKSSHAAPEPVAEAKPERGEEKSQPNLVAQPFAETNEVKDGEPTAPVVTAEPPEMVKPEITRSEAPEPVEENEEDESKHVVPVDLKDSTSEQKFEETRDEKPEEKTESTLDQKLEAERTNDDSEPEVREAAPAAPTAEPLPGNLDPAATLSVSPAEIPPQASSNDVPEGTTPSSPSSTSEASAVDVASPSFTSEIAAAVFDHAVAGGISDMAKKESEVAATTAAAWASWRRIRETGDPKSTHAAESSNSDDLSEEKAAMAVAAGAERSPEEAPESEEIASIVDSVLADLRPKIVEEISRKLGKKK